MGANLIFLLGENILRAQVHWAICEKCTGHLYCFPLKEGHLVQEGYSNPRMVAPSIFYKKTILPEMLFP